MSDLESRTETQQMGSFGETEYDPKFAEAFPWVPEAIDDLQKLYKKKSEAISNIPEPEYTFQKRALEKYYQKTLSDISSSVLKSDYEYLVREGKKVGLTEQVRNNIHVYRNLLLRKGLIGVGHCKPTCVVCGKTAESGDLFVMVHKDNTAACLDCCTSAVKLDKLTEVVFID